MIDPTTPPDRARFLDGLAMKDWPALESTALDGWVMRASRGATRRANSVWSHGSLEDLAVKNKLEQAEAFFAARDLSSTFYVSPATRPHELDQLLEDRGYLEEGGTLVHTGRLGDMIDGAGAAHDASVELVEKPDDGWLDAHFRCSRRSGEDARTRAEIIRRVGPSAAFASAIIGSEVVAVANGVLSSGWLGIYNVVTDPQFRRRGASLAVLKLLAEWAIRQGAEHAHLGVEEDNPGAIALYERLGMTMVYRYHYRVRQLNASTRNQLG